MRGKSVRSGRSSSARNGGVMKSLGLKNVSGETVVICVLLVILLVLVIYYVRQNSEGFQGNNSPKCDLYVFVADWCPHCQKAKPVVDNLKNNLPKNVNVNVVNESDSNSRSLMNQYKVRGFPTILLVKENGEVVEFVERVTEDNVVNFVAANNTNAANEVMANNGNGAVNNGNAARNNGNAARNNGNAARNNGNAARNNGNAARNNGNAARNNGMANVNGNAARNNGMRNNGAANNGL